MIRVIVDNRVRVPIAELPQATATALKELLEHANPEYAMKQSLGLPTWSVPRVLRTWRLEGDDLTLPRGGMGRAREVFAEHGVAYRVEDRRSEGAIVRGKLRYRGHPLRDYQREMVATGIRKEQCILRASTGSGKTEAAFALAAEIELNTLVVLPTSALFEQWSERAKRCLGVKGDALGVVRGPKRRLRTLTLAMQATLARGLHEEVRDFFGAVIVDETQRAAADSLVRVIDGMPARYRIGVSASEKRKDRKECLIYDLFGDVAYEADRARLEAAGHVLDVQIRVVPTSFRADWYGHPDAAGEGEEKDLDFGRLLEAMVADRKRDELVLRMVDDELDAGEQALVFTARREHARILDTHFVRANLQDGGRLEGRATSGLLLGDQEAQDGAEYERTRAGIVDGSVRVGVGTYQAVGFGIDLPAVSVGAAMTPIASNPQQTNQVRGRLCRPNPKAGKTEGRLYYLFDQYVYPSHLKKLVATNANVVVWSGGAWVDAREHLSRRRSG